MTVVLRWWLIAWLTNFGISLAAVLGFFQYLWVSDATKLSFITIALFTGTTIFIGMLTYSARSGDQQFTKHLPLLWFLCEKMLGLGMIGTLIGFLVLLEAALGGGINLSDATATQQIISNMAVGFATAGLTTLVGLVCSLITKLQLINLEYMVKD